MILFPKSAINSDKISSNFGNLSYVLIHLYNCRIYNSCSKGNFFFCHNFPSSCDVSRAVRHLTPDGFGEQKIEMPNQRVVGKKQKLAVDEVARVKKSGSQKDSEWNHWTLIRWWKGILTGKKKRFMNHSSGLYNRINSEDVQFSRKKKTLVHFHWIENYVLSITILLA